MIRGAKVLLGVLLALASAGCSSGEDGHDEGTENDGASGAGAGEAGTNASGSGGDTDTAGTGAAGTSAGSSAGAAGDDTGVVPTAGNGESGSGGDGDGDGDGDGSGGIETDPTTPFTDLPDNCKGFEVVGLEHSPGGDTLPNTCAPFHPMRNNPYAIRCIDANPDYDTGYPGDEFCVLPPPPDLGLQFGVIPASYENPDPGFLLPPGDEVTDYYFGNAGNTEERFFYRVNLRMRAGSHHMINRMLDADRADGWSTMGDANVGGGGRSFPGAQRPDQDRPQGTLEVPPENAGLGDRLMVNQQFSYNLHHFNLSDDVNLREVWVNAWYKPESEVTDEIGGIAIFGPPQDVTTPPGTRNTLHYRCNVSQPSRIITLNGHRHAHTERFGVWLVRGGETEAIYESFDYNDMPTYQYDSISLNPVPSLEERRDGAKSGMFEVQPGDELHFVCDINNTSSNTLRFANEVQTGEMCILFGSRTGGALCGQGTRVMD